MEEVLDIPSSESCSTADDPALPNHSSNAAQGDILENQRGNEGNEPTLIDLPWEDVIFVYILPHLSMKDILNLRNVNKDYRTLANSYISSLKTIQWESLDPKDVEDIEEETGSLVELNFPYNYQINDDSLRELLHRNKNLASVTIACCRTVVGIGVYPIINLKKLTVLNVRRNYWVNNAFIELITQHLDSLCEVDVSFSNVEDSSMVPFFQKFTRLKKVEIESCVQLTDISVLTLGSSCLGLEFLNISNNKKITLNAISSIIYACKNIQCIELMGCSDFSIPYIKFIDLPIP